MVANDSIDSNSKDGKRPLAGRVALVTGASRGIGRGIALGLAVAGATVYITGRRPSGNSASAGLPSLEQTAKEIEERSGKAPRLVYCDHANSDDTRRLFEQIDAETDGQLDILVNNAYSAVKAIMDNMGRPFFECDPEIWDVVNDVGLRNYYVCSVYAARLMTRRNRGGLIVNVSSAGGLKYLFNVAYGVGKAGVDRLSADTAVELRKYGVSVVSIWPGLVQTEMIVDAAQQGQLSLERTPKEGMMKRVEESETPEFVGQVVAGLAADDPSKVLRYKSGRILTTADLADEYHLRDVNGLTPPNLRSISTLLLLAGYGRLAGYVPRFIKIPKVVLHLLSNKF